ncbi:MAG: hypothetical protein K2G39_10360, partial [Lachnospiraceae bacterium]|nr:hypothetical protein [Lachnospiraceae bacterium]
IKLIHDKVKKIKLSERMGVKYMQLWEEKAYLVEEARAEGIKAFILDNLEDGKSAETIIAKLIRRFSLSEQDAQQYYKKCKQDCH